MKALPFLVSIVVAIFTVHGSLKAQPPDTLWTRVIGGESREDYATIIETPDGGFLLNYDSIVDSNLYYIDVFVQKLTELGELVWSVRLGGMENDLDTRMAMDENGQAMIAYLSRPDYNGECYPLRVVKLSLSGDVLQSHLFCLYYESRPFGICRLPDGRYIVGVFRNLSPAMPDGFGLLFLNDDGDSLDFRDFPNVEDQILRDAFSVFAASDGRIAVVGASADYQHDPPYHWPNPFLFALDSNGDSLWERVYPIGTRAFSCDETHDRGFVIAIRDSNSISQSNLKVVRTDELGYIVWDRSFGGDGMDIAYRAIECADSSIVVHGSKSDPVLNDQCLLIKLSPDGDSLWSVIYGGERREHVQRSNLSQTSDGGYITTQFSNSFGGSDQNFDVWVVRFDSDGSPVAERYAPSTPRELQVSAYPNPFNSSTTISFDLPSSSRVTLRIHNISGQRVTELTDNAFTAGHHQVEFDASYLTSGIYFCSLSTTKETEVGKLLLVR